MLYLTPDEKVEKVIGDILFFVEKLEKKYKVEIKYNVDDIRHANSKTKKSS